VFIYLGSRDVQRGEEAVAGIRENVGGAGASRIEFLHIDVSNDASVSAAAAVVSEKIGNDKLFAIVNNAGIAVGNTLEAIVETNVNGPRRVTDAFLPLLTQTADVANTGRIVNISSAAGPMFIAKQVGAGADCSVLLNANTTWADIESFIAATGPTISDDAYGPYGLSKACLNVYTLQTAKAHPQLLVNSCTPGFIDTDLTRAFESPNKGTPESGTVSALYCLFSNEVGTGRYYGSDAKRSPLDRYRAPGDPAYEPEA
jgi:NAD(P)-dependent dehydrogenase (short-subunit alcohol dehydrogenase family)